MKYILFIGALLCSLTSYTQVYKFRAFETKVAYYDENGKDTSSNEWEKKDLLIVIDQDRKKITIYSKKEFHIDLVSDSLIHDENGSYAMYVGVDDSGNKLEATYYKFSNQSLPHKGNLVLDYGRYAIAYRLKNTE